MQQNHDKQAQRDREYKDKFSRFEDNLKRKMDWFQENVANPKANQQRLESERQRVQMEVNNQQVQLRDEAASHMRKLAQKQTYDQVKQQMDDKSKMRELEKQLMLVERDAFGRVIQQNQQVEQVMADEKKQKQMLYRELLNTQM